MTEEILNSQNLVILKTPENKILEWTFLEEKDGCYAELCELVKNTHPMLRNRLKPIYIKTIFLHEDKKKARELWDHLIRHHFEKTEKKVEE